MTTRTLPPLPLIARDLLQVVKWMAIVWAVLLIVIAGIIGGTTLLYHPPTSSILDGSLNAPRYWGFVTGIFVTYGALPMYVAAGLTRRRFVANGIVVVLGAAITAGVITAVSFFVEGRIYAAEGWNHKLTQPHLFASSDQLGLALVEFTLVYGTYFFAGWLIGSAFYRWKLFAIPVALGAYGLALATEASLGSGWISSTLHHTVGDLRSLPLAVPVGLAAIAAMAAATWGLLRDVAVAPRRS